MHNDSEQILSDYSDRGPLTPTSSIEPDKVVLQKSPSQSFVEYNGHRRLETSKQVESPGRTRKEIRYHGHPTNGTGCTKHTPLSPPQTVDQISPASSKQPQLKTEPENTTSEHDISAIAVLTGRKIFWRDREYKEISLLEPWSDGKNEAYIGQDMPRVETPKNWLIALAQLWVIRNLRLSKRRHVFYILDKLPDHYRLHFVPENIWVNKKPRLILIGHPHRDCFFNGIEEFWPHFKFMMAWKTHKGCACVVCSDLRKRGYKGF